MTAIPHAAEAITSALDRFGSASSRLLEAVTGVDGDAGEALVGMIEAKTQLKASVAVISFSEEMWSVLIDISQEPGQH